MASGQSALEWQLAISHTLGGTEEKGSPTDRHQSTDTNAHARVPVITQQVCNEALLSAHLIMSTVPEGFSPEAEKCKYD